MPPADDEPDDYCGEVLAIVCSSKQASPSTCLEVHMPSQPSIEHCPFIPALAKQMRAESAFDEHHTLFGEVHSSMSRKYCVFTLLIATFFTTLAMSQSLTSGDITGVVTDLSGAVISGANVTLTSNATHAQQTQTTSAQGAYRFALLPPGSYTLSISAQNLQSSKQAVTVTVGQATTLNVQLQLGSTTETVEVSGQGGVVQADTADLSTSFSPEQIAQVPNPGNDLSYVVQTAPGATMNTQGGYGNTATYGLPATRTCSRLME
jgi:hypothetical protein